MPGHWAQDAPDGEGTDLALEESVLYRHRFEGPSEAVAAGGEDATRGEPAARSEHAGAGARGEDVTGGEDETSVEDAGDVADPWRRG